MINVGVIWVDVGCAFLGVNASVDIYDKDGYSPKHKKEEEKIVGHGKPVEPRRGGLCR